MNIALVEYLGKEEFVLNILATHGIKSRLQEWIDAANLNYSTLAEESGVDVGAVKRLAKNQFDRVDCGNWRKLCEYFGKPLGELFYLE